MYQISSAKSLKIFKDKNIDVDYLPDIGKDKEKLAEIIKSYDGLAIRSATKVTDKILSNAKNLKVIGRAGIGVDNVDIETATTNGVIVMNTPFGNSVTTAEHAITLMMSLQDKYRKPIYQRRIASGKNQNLWELRLLEKLLG